MEFEEAYADFYREFGKSRRMVLSTSLRDFVTSRMMSIVVLGDKFYFQTDRTFRKYRQLKGNQKVSLCIENIQIEGKCEEVGRPCDNMEFSDAYKKYFLSAYTRYTALENERLFSVTPVFIERWRYLEDAPYIETFDITNRRYVLKRYTGTEENV